MTWLDKFEKITQKVLHQKKQKKLNLNQKYVQNVHYYK
jgi:hypothetical protein